MRELARLENYITPYEKLGVFYAVLRHAPSATSEADDLIHFFILVLKAAVRRRSLKHYLAHVVHCSVFVAGTASFAVGGRVSLRRELEYAFSVLQSAVMFFALD